MVEDDIKPAESPPKGLIPNSERTPEQLAEMGRKGGIASGEAKREKKYYREMFLKWLEKEHKIVTKDGIAQNISGEKLTDMTIGKIMSRGDSSSVALMRLMADKIDGTELNVSVEGNSFVSIIVEGVKLEPDSDKNSNP